MPVSDPHEFAQALYEEHLEEASVLYDQWRDRFEGADLPWWELDDSDRMEAHLDALVVGGDLALATALEADADEGERHAAVRLFCRVGRSDLANAALEATDPDDADDVAAVVSAFVAEMPEAWEAGALRADLLGDARRLRLAADLALARELDARQALAAALPDAPDTVRARVVAALGRRAEAVGPKPFHSLLADARPDVRREAAVALLRTGHAEASRVVLEAVRTDPALVPALGLAGRETAVPWLSTVLAHPEAGPDAALALALLGAPAAVPALIDALRTPHAAQAAEALALITDAPLVDETAEPGTDPDALFADEAVALSRGERVAAAGGAPIEGVSRDPERWSAWWATHRERFAAADRYRLGMPAGPATTVASLAAPHVPPAVRPWIAHELVVRYRMPVAFEATWSVERQRAALAAMTTWAASAPAVAGRWYVGGRYA